jgi:hypothetical protein
MIYGRNIKAKIVIMSFMIFSLVFFIGCNKAEEQDKITKESITNTPSASPNKDADKNVVQSNIKIKYYEKKDVVIGICKNNNKFSVYINPKMIFYDKNNEKIGFATDDAYIPCGGEYMLRFLVPEDTIYNNISYANYSVDINATQTEYIDYSNYIDYSSRIASDGRALIELKNKSENNLNVSVAIVYYSSKKKVIGYGYAFCDALESNSEDLIYGSFNYSDDYNGKRPSFCKTYVLCNKQ